MAVSDGTHVEGSEVSGPRLRLPYQALYAIAAGLVVVAIVLVVWVLNRDTTGPSTTLPPPVTQSATPSVTSTPSPSPTSPEDRAAADADAAFRAYIKALDVVGQTGGDKAAVAKAAKLTTKDGAERKYLTGTYAKDLRSGKFAGTGWSKVTSRVNAIELGEKPPRVDLTACIDQSALKVTKNGKPFKNPKMLRYAANLYLVDGEWRIDQVQNASADLKPAELTACEP